MVEPTTDQHIANVALVGPGVFIAWGGIFGAIAASYLLPVMATAAIISAARKVPCPSCGHRFNFWQAGG